MSLEKAEATPATPFPIRSLSASREATFQSLLSGSTNGSTGSVSIAAVGQLMDLIADQRSDLLQVQIDTLTTCEKTREQANALVKLVSACGVADSQSPCATALAIAADLDKLVHSKDVWTHPAQVIRHPNAKALHRLCAQRVRDASGLEREQLEEVLPRLERAARLSAKAASRRKHGAAR
ncbi:MAG: hypothetical protein AAF560_06365 [Acidobacteriota bacterium]